MGSSDWTMSPCPLCGGVEAVLRFAMEGLPFQVIQCKGCGLARTYPPVPTEELHQYYPPSYYGENNRRFHPLLEKLVMLFRARRARRMNRSHPPGSILDVGCGRGHFLEYLQRKGWRACGVELSEVAAKHAREVHGLEVHVGDFMTAPYPPRSFDVVVFWHVMEHLTDPDRALARASELLREGGLLAVAVPNFASIQARLAGRRWFHLDIPRHFWHFGSATLRQALAKHGFMVERMDHFCVEQNIYGWLQSLFNLMGFEFNLLYNLLKNPSARDIKSPIRSHPLQTIGMIFLLPVLFPLSCLLFLTEVAVRRGGTIEVYARKNSSGPPTTSPGA